MVGGTKRPPQDSESGPWSHEQSNTKSNSNTKTFHEEESQNLSRVHVSLDNADTVIEVAHISPRRIPPFRLVLVAEALWVPHFSWGSRSGGWDAVGVALG